ncbi:MAG TPA: hypothetical protein VK579_05410, partial [Terriglobales bacterium]|nr:hypothetical protein [Terriglobales bacterium]
MHLEKPILARYLSDPSLKGYTALQKIFFASTEPSQAAGAAFIERLAQRRDDRDLASGPDFGRSSDLCASGLGEILRRMVREP